LLPKLFDFAFLKGIKNREKDVSVSVFGPLNENITFTAGVFAANKNISQLQGTVEAALTSLRFDRVNYKWIQSASEWAYFDLKAPKDGDL